MSFYEYAFAKAAEREPPFLDELPAQKEKESVSEGKRPFWNPDTKAGLVMGAAAGAATPSLANAVASKVVGRTFGIDDRKLLDLLDGMSMNDLLDILKGGVSEDSRVRELAGRIGRKTLPRRLAARASWALPLMLTAGASGTCYGHMRAGDGDEGRSFREDAVRDSGKRAALGGASFALPPLLSAMEPGGSPLAYVGPVDACRLLFGNGKGVDLDGKKDAWMKAGKADKALKAAVNIGKYAVPGAAIGGLSAMAQNAVHHGLRSLFDDGGK